jgi:hypothetical protein
VRTVGGGVVAREPVEVVARDAGKVRHRALAGERGPAPPPRSARRGATARRASASRRAGQRGLLAHEVLHHSVAAAFERVELRLHLHDATVELLERSALLAERPVDALELREERHLAAPRGQRALARLVELAADLAERLLPGLEVLTARGWRAGPRGPTARLDPSPTTRSPSARHGRRPTCIASNRVRRGWRPGRGQPERRAEARERGQPGRRQERQGIEPQHRAEPAAGPRRAGLGGEQQEREPEQRATVERRMAWSHGWRGGGAASTRPARRRIPTSTAPAPAGGDGRGGGRGERGEAEGGGQPEPAQEQSAPKPLERLDPAERRLHLHHARHRSSALDESLELLAPSVGWG